MAIVRNIDVTMQSEISFDDACRAAIAEAAKTLRGILSFRIKDAECVNKTYPTFFEDLERLRA